MCYAKDNGHDIYDAEDLIGIQEGIQDDLEDYWRSGKHKDSEGKVWNIWDMETSHIKNTIAYFRKKWPDIDARPLINELERRKFKGDTPTLNNI